MKCYTCGHENSPGSKFCSGCGKNFRAKSQPQLSKNNYPNPLAIAARDAILQAKSKKVTNIWKVGLITIVLFNIALVLLAGPNFFNLWGSVVMFIITTFISLGVNGMKEHDYYTIPTSRDDNGQHHCIDCGNKGIYKSTIYKSKTVVNKCSKCETVLFYS